MSNVYEVIRFIEHLAMPRGGWIDGRYMVAEFDRDEYFFHDGISDLIRHSSRRLVKIGKCYWRSIIVGNRRRIRVLCVFNTKLHSRLMRKYGPGPGTIVAIDSIKSNEPLAFRVGFTRKEKIRPSYKTRRKMTGEIN